MCARERHSGLLQKSLTKLRSLAEQVPSPYLNVQYPPFQSGSPAAAWVYWEPHQEEVGVTPATQPPRKPQLYNLVAYRG